MLIRGIGEFWNPDIIDWGAIGAGNRGSLAGIAEPERGDHFEVDVWDATAVYVLYSEFRPIYVGQADKRLGPRVREHLGDRLAGRWDLFSWYCLSTLNRTHHNVRAPGKRQLAPGTVLDTVEAVLIQALQPPLNRRYSSIPAATKVRQAAAPNTRSIRAYLEEILSGIEAWSEPNE